MLVFKIEQILSKYLWFCTKIIYWLYEYYHDISFN